MFYFNYNDFKILGSSPEILVRLRKNRITIRPIAGTRPRGKNINEDKKYENELIRDKKELAEHLMLLDLEEMMLVKFLKLILLKLLKILKLKNIHM